MVRKQWLTPKVLGLVACLAMSSVAMAAGRPGSGGGNGSKPTFTSLCSAFDSNRDGALAKSEVPANVWNRLKAADTNKDNLVTQPEFVAAGGNP